LPTSAYSLYNQATECTNDLKPHSLASLVLKSLMSEPPPIHEAPESISEKRDIGACSGNAVAFMMSMVIHVLVLLALACLVYQSSPKSRGLWFSAAQGSGTEALEVLDGFELAAATEEVPLEPNIESAETMLNVSLSTELVKSGNTGQGAASLTSLSVGDVVASLKSGGREKGASFFGTYAEGNRFVYVLDSSRSMRGDRWTYACHQLLDSLNALKPGQEFFVICFDEKMSYMLNLRGPKATYHAPDEETIERVRRWLRARGNSLGRATMPAEALQAGLTFNPDAIFMLSDGELEDNTIAVLRTINGFSAEPRQIPIHTVHLFSPRGRTTLELIAMENNGTFTHIEGK
jgi:hypothetical protein